MYLRAWRRAHSLQDLVRRISSVTTVQPASFVDLNPAEIRFVSTLSSVVNRPLTSSIDINHYRGTCIFAHCVYVILARYLLLV